MVLAEILKKDYLMSDEQAAQVISFARFLEMQNKSKPIGSNANGKPIYREAGALKGKIIVSDDFDEPLEEFKAIPHKDSAADALQIFSSDCIKIPQEY